MDQICLLKDHMDSGIQRTLGGYKLRLYQESKAL